MWDKRWDLLSLMTSCWEAMLESSVLYPNDS